jgi:hypothetical protein
MKNIVTYSSDNLIQMRDILAHFTSSCIRISLLLAAMPSLSFLTKRAAHAEGHETGGAAPAEIE